MGVKMATIAKRLWVFRKLIIVIATPLLLLPLPLVVPGQEALCGYCILLMAVYWCTEALPLPVTSLIPLFLVPLLQLLTAAEVAAAYFKDVAWVVVGGLLMAQAMEASGLHRRVALSILVLVGTQPMWLMMGFMLPTWFLSMWINNTAATSMMIPIMDAVLLKLENIDDSQENEGMNGGRDIQTCDNGMDTNSESNSVSIVELQSLDNIEVTTDNASGTSYQVVVESSRQVSLGKALPLCIAYSANVGGMATLMGSVLNLIMKDAADSVWQAYGEGESPVNFSSWLIFCLPLAVIDLILLWLWLIIYYMGPRALLCCMRRKQSTAADDRQKAAGEVLKQEHKQLPSMSFQEIVVIIAMVIMVLLWFFRSPGFMKGWGDLLPAGYDNDCIPAMMMSLILFIIPRTLAGCRRTTQPNAGDAGMAAPILEWSSVSRSMPWGIFAILGGGMVLAQASVQSGLSDTIASAAGGMQGLPDWLIVTILTFIISLAAEVVSNTVACTLTMPICASLAKTLDINPLYIMFPVALGTGLVFMLPVATPPNALIRATERVTILDMVRCGAMLKLLSLLSVLAIFTWGEVCFDLQSTPWNSTNVEATYFTS